MDAMATSTQSLSDLDLDVGGRPFGYAPYSPVSIDGFTPMHYIRRASIIRSFFISFAPAIKTPVLDPAEARC